MAVLNVNSKEEFETIITSNEIVFVDFWAAWCGPCKMVAPIVEKVADEMQQIQVCKVNVDDVPQLAKEYGVMSIPTLILFQNGQVSKTSVGVMTKDEMINFIKNSSEGV